MAGIVDLRQLWLVANVDESRVAEVQSGRVTDLKIVFDYSGARLVPGMGVAVTIYTHDTPY